MIKAIIIDDEKHCIDRLVQLIKTNTTNIEIIGIYNSIESGYEGIKSLKPNLVFLDIQIHNKTGFDMLKKFDSINFHVIFTTAFENYAIQAIKFSAFDYLLKPIDPIDLVNTVSRLIDKHYQNYDDTYKSLLQNLLNLKSQNKKITIQTQTETLLLNIQDIIRCESDVNYTTLYTNQNKKILVSKTLKDFETLLKPYNFFRVHNSHLINLEHMKSYDKGKGGYVRMSDNSVVEVSIRRKEDFLLKVYDL
jgi:two-component system LytT family response regulator